MTETTIPASSSPVPQRNLLSRLVGVVFSPRDTYAAVAARPTWFAVLAITLVVGAACQYVILSSPELQDNIIDQQIIAMREGGGGSDAQIAGIETFVQDFMVPAYTIGTFVIGPMMVAAIAGLYLLIFSMLMGGAATFKQVFSVVTHSGVISTLSGLFSAAMVLAGVPPSGMQPPSANLSIFLPMLEEGSFPAVFLSVFNLMLIWWVLSMSIGLGVLYRRRTGPIFVSLMTVYVLIALIIAVVSS